jgi:hypothetical protein
MGVNVSWQDCIAWLDAEESVSDWRDYPDNFDPPSELRGDIALEFLKQNQTWLSDIAVPIYDHQLEWVAMMFDSANASKVNQLTVNAIWHYIKHGAHQWLIECEEASIAW